MADSWSEKQIDNYVNDLAERSKYVKTGENVIHLDYFGFLLDKKELEQIEGALKKNGFELSHYDKTYSITASLDDYILSFYLLFNEQTTKSILSDIFKNTVWEFVKSITLQLWRKYKSKVKSEKLTLNQSTIGKINFGIKFRLDRKRQLDFKLSGNISEETAIRALDKVLVFMRNEKPTDLSQPTMEIIDYSTKKKKWVRMNVLEEVKRKTKTKSSRKKKRK